MSILAFTHNCGRDVWNFRWVYPRKRAELGKCVGICTDGANTMAGVHKRVVTQLQEVRPKAKFIHCNLHREALVTKGCPSKMKTVFNETLKTVKILSKPER